jgi:hypothetical protein
MRGTRIVTEPDTSNVPSGSDPVWKNVHSMMALRDLGTLRFEVGGMISVCGSPPVGVNVTVSSPKAIGTPTRDELLSWAGVHCPLPLTVIWNVSPKQVNSSGGVLGSARTVPAVGAMQASASPPAINKRFMCGPLWSDERFRTPVITSIRESLAPVNHAGPGGITTSHSREGANLSSASLTTHVEEDKEEKGSHASQQGEPRQAPQHGSRLNTSV